MSYLFHTITRIIRLDYIIFSLLSKISFCCFLHTVRKNMTTEHIILSGSAAAAAVQSQSTSRCNGILKLQIGDKPVHCISIDSILGGDGSLSFHKLLKLAALHLKSTCELEDPSRSPMIELYHVNSENTWKLLSCDAELNDAFHQVKSNLKKPIRTVRSPFSKCVIAIDDGSKVPVLTCKAVKIEKSTLHRVFSAPGANGYVPSFVRKGAIRNPPRRSWSSRGAAKHLPRWASSSKNNNSHFQNAAKSLTTGVSAITEKLQIKLETASKFRLTDDDRENLLSILDGIGHLVEEKAAVVEKSLHNTIGKIIPQEAVPSGDSNLDSGFVHGRHSCDGCKSSPIIGIRYHATNIPNFDLCENCVGKYGKSGIKLIPEQFECDSHFKVKDIALLCQEEYAAVENGMSVTHVDTAQCETVVTNEESHLRDEISGNEAIEQPKAKCDKFIEEVTISDFNFHPVMPLVVTGASKGCGNESLSRDPSQKLIDDFGLNFERCILALGGVVHEAVEGGIKLSNKTKEHAAVIVAAVTQAKDNASNSVTISSREWKRIHSFAEERGSSLSPLNEDKKKERNLKSKRGTRTVSIEFLKNHDMLNRIRNNLSNITVSSKTTHDEMVDTSPNLTCTQDQGIHDGISTDKSNCGQISDKDFQQFLSWWSTCEKGTIVSQQLTNRNVEEGHSNEIAAPMMSNEELSDELLAHFFSICSKTYSPTTDSKQSLLLRRLVKEPLARTCTQDNGQLSDEDFNSFMSAWSTCEKPSGIPPKSIVPASLKNDGMLHDEEFQNFMRWWSTTKKAFDGLVLKNSFSGGSIDSDSKSFRSVDIASSAKLVGSVSSDASLESKSGRMELELEDGTIVISPDFNDYVEIRDSDDWDFVDASMGDSDMIGRAAVTLGISMFQEDLTRSNEALSEPTVVISNASDVILSKTTSQVSLDTLVSLVSSATSEDYSDMSFVSSVESVASWASVNSTI